MKSLTRQYHVTAPTRKLFVEWTTSSIKCTNGASVEYLWELCAFSFCLKSVFELS